MAKIQLFVPHLLKWEGGYSNDPDDAGGMTNIGVTYRTWLLHGIDIDCDGQIDEKDLKLISRQDVVKIILKPHYWDKCRADEIESQAVANLLVDWFWCSGLTAIRCLQRILNVKCDGIMGNITLREINQYRDPKALCRLIKMERIEYLQRICIARPRNRKFYRGWINRINALNDE